MNGSNESSYPLNQRNKQLCVSAMASKIMNLLKSFFMGLPWWNLGSSTNLLGALSMRSYNLLSRRLLGVESLVGSMVLRVLQSLNQIARNQKLTSKWFVFLSCFSFYTQMNSYCNTQMDVFLQ